MIIRNVSTQNKNACAKESKENSSQKESVEGMEVEGSNVVKRIITAHNMVRRL
jgi:hypothetical protein